MAEAGIDISAEFPKRYEDWEIGDRDGKTLDQVRIIRDQIKDKVTALLQSIEPAVKS